MSEKKSLEVNDVLFKLRHQTAEKKLVIDHVTSQLAHAGSEYTFVKDEVDPIIRITKELGYSKLFGETFVLETPENKEKYERQIKLRFIRNFQFDLLSDSQLKELEKFLKIYQL